VQAQIANYPFTTIEPNHGTGFVRIDCIDTFFKVQCNPRTGYCKNHQRFVPVDLVDVAGLVPGASEGKGLGNKFLDDLRKADALIHVIDCSGSTNEKGEPVALNSYDPANDIKFLETEIDLWFKGVVEKNILKIARKRFESKSELLQSLSEIFSGLCVKSFQLEKAINACNLIEKKLFDWTQDDFLAFAIQLRKQSKPIIIAANKIDLPGAIENLGKLKKQFPEQIIFGCSADSELALKKAVNAALIEYLPGDADFKILKDLSAGQSQALTAIQKNVLEKLSGTGCEKILNAIVFDLLKCIAIFPAGSNKLVDSEGRILPDCFIMPPGTTALDFAFSLHSDIGNNFIRAINVKTKQLVGKDHKLEHRDAIEIIFNK